MKLIRVLLTMLAFIYIWGNAGALAAAPALRVGIPMVNGYNEKDDEGYYSGYNCDYMQALAHYAGMRCVFVEGTWEQCLDWVQNGTIDVMPGLVKTTERQQRLDYGRLPMGTENTMLFLRNGTDSIQNFSNLGRDFRIGYLQQEYKSDYLPQLAAEEGFRYEEKGYTSMAALTADYRSGEVDGFLSDSMYHGYALAAARFDPESIYFVVQKGNDGLLRRLDMAADALNINDPHLLGRLSYQYYIQRYAAPLVLSNREKAYLQEKKILRVMVVPKEKPYAYFENHGFQGILAEFLNRLADDLGLAVEIVPADNDQEAFIRMGDGEADILLNVYSNYSWGDSHGLNISSPYMSVGYVAVTRRMGQLPEVPRVACLAGNFFTHAHVEPMYPDASQRLYFDTVDECLQAVSDGRADVTYVKNTVAQYNIWQGKYPDLMARGDTAFSHDVSVGVTQQADPRLLRILDKEINHLDANTMQNITNEALASLEQSKSLRSLLYTYPLHFLIGILTAAIIVCLLLFHMMRMRRRHMENVRQMAYEDSGTRLNNRHWLEKEGPKIAAELPERQQAGLSVVLFALHRMDILIGTYGRENVAVMLRKIGLALQRTGWVLALGARTGAGQLVCLCCEEKKDELEKYIWAIFKKHEYMTVGELSARISMQVGICYLGHPPLSIAQAMSCADLAAHEANPVRFFDASLKDHMAFNQQMESCMEKALAKGEFEVWYQPKYDIRTHSCIGAEALVRWRSSRLGFLMPGRFIELFERNGFVVRLDFYMLESVFRFQRQRLQAGLPIVPISVNQSRLHMTEEGYLEKMRQVLSRYQKVPAGAVELELTETAFMGFNDAQRVEALSIVGELQAMGFAISMDDFGSGYSDLSLLNALPMDVMKLDRTLLNASEDSERMQIVLAQVISLGTRLHMQVICEGIETVEQEQLLLANGCSCGQGFLYAKPMPEQDFKAFLTEHSKR